MADSRIICKEIYQFVAFISSIQAVHCLFINFMPYHLCIYQNSFIHNLSNSSTNALAACASLQQTHFSTTHDKLCNALESDETT